MGKQPNSPRRIPVVIDKTGTSTIRRLQSFTPTKITDSLGSLEGAEILKRTANTIVYKVPGRSGEDESLCVKEYGYPSFITRLKAFITSRPYRAWTAGCHLRELGIPVIEVLAFMRTGTLPRTDHLFVTYYENILTLYDYSRTASSEYLPESQQRAVSSAVAQALALLHKHKVYHNDLKGQNILIDRYQTMHPRCIFCDLDSIIVWRRLSLRRIAKNLAQINTCLPDCISDFARMRFFVSYIRFIKRGGITIAKRKLLSRTIDLSKKRETRRLRRQQAASAQE